MNAKRIAELGSPHMRQSTTWPQSWKAPASCSSVTCAAQTETSRATQDRGLRTELSLKECLRRQVSRRACWSMSQMYIVRRTLSAICFWLMVLRFVALLRVGCMLRTPTALQWPPTTWLFPVLPALPRLPEV